MEFKFEFHTCICIGVGGVRGLGESLEAYDGIDSIRHLTNFGRSVLGCIEAYGSETRRIFQHFSKSTRCEAQISISVEVESHLKFAFQEI